MQQRCVLPRRRSRNRSKRRFSSAPRRAHCRHTASAEAQRPARQARTPAASRIEDWRDCSAARLQARRMTRDQWRDAAFALCLHVDPLRLTTRDHSNANVAVCIRECYTIDLTLDLVE